jgi:hypothetical protein
MIGLAAVVSPSERLLIKLSDVFADREEHVATG